MDVRKEYTNGDLTVVWKPGLCFHAKECVKGLPAVFNPKEKPWIKAENAGIEELKKTINKCPSGALTYYLKGEGAPEDEKQNTMSETKVEVLENGPLMVKGTIEITHTDGSKESKTRNTAFCRCGKTGNTPFCDGSHNN
ncbi:MAG: (4Fe-4S)-binding protein [Bacteroidia bacterium]|nr:(4Fe-4S)-binding protein [Bacteroidia bacterium]NNF32023.1 hypothetical protein [Flavobacteriaceae bacterium]MBT8276474.1 (4Fe-4S)-binding protein [Bacteroidia bacterium]NNJ80730.1 hypothetical protein [Flavobacteriaceae bacterium]NNK53457.1 hypothetical protein [Flavobacteriaceae bacterium]